MAYNIPGTDIVFGNSPLGNMMSQAGQVLYNVIQPLSMITGIFGWGNSWDDDNSGKEQIRGNAAAMNSSMTQWETALGQSQMGSDYLGSVNPFSQGYTSRNGWTFPLRDYFNGSAVAQVYNILTGANRSERAFAWLQNQLTDIPDTLTQINDDFQGYAYNTAETAYNTDYPTSTIGFAEFGELINDGVTPEVRQVLFDNGWDVDSIDEIGMPPEAVELMHQLNSLRGTVSNAILNNAIDLLNRQQSVNEDLNNTTAEWQGLIDGLDTDIGTADTRLAEITTALQDVTLTVADRNALLEEQAQLSLARQFDQGERESYNFNLQSILHQQGLHADEIATFMQSIQGMETPNTDSLTEFANSLNQFITDTEAARSQEEQLRLQREQELVDLNIQHAQLQTDYEAGQITIDELNVEQARLNEEIVGHKVEQGRSEMNEIEREYREKMRPRLNLKVPMPEDPDIKPPEGYIDSTSFNIGSVLGQPQVPVAPVIAPPEQQTPEAFLGAPEIPTITGTLTKASTIGDKLKEKNQQTNGSIGNVFA